MSSRRDPEIVEMLPEYALGTLSGDDAVRVERAIADDPSLLAELCAWQETVATLSLALPTEPVSPDLWARVEARLVQPRRFAAFTARVAAALDVAEDVARRMLDGIDVAASWVGGPGPGARLYHIEPGPEILAVGGIAGFVEVEPGASFPRHLHEGDEHVLVLQGGFRDEDGTDVVAGEDGRKASGTSHTFVAHAGEPLILLAVIRGKVDFGDGFEL